MTSCRIHCVATGEFPIDPPFHQCRLASLSSDPNNRKAADLLHQRYMALDQEMEEIGRMWAGAKTDLSRHAKQKVRTGT